MGFSYPKKKKKKGKCYCYYADYLETVATPRSSITHVTREANFED